MLKLEEHFYRVTWQKGELCFPHDNASFVSAHRKVIHLCSLVLRPASNLPCLHADSGTGHKKVFGFVPFQTDWGT